VDLVGDKTMGFTMDALCGFFAGGLDQAEDRATAFVNPIFFVIDPILGLNFKIVLVRICDRFCVRAVNLVVDIQI